jgi:CBS domain-containing protein
MTVDQRNIVVCPSCGAENIEGVDTCESCTMDLRSIDIPEGAQLLAEHDLTLPISTIRLSRPRTVTPMQTVRDAIASMKQDPSGAVVVVEGVNIVGIFTDRDVLKKAAARQGALDESIAYYMTPDPVVLREDDMMAYALNKMGDGGFRHIPVVRDGELVGMVTIRDIMAWILGKYFD